MAEGQVGAAIGASEVPIYYVPKPGKAPNVFAELMSGFLQTRNPAAMALFMARLREMDPSARIGEILRAAELDAAQQRAMINLAVSNQQSATSLARAALQLEGVRYTADTQASMKAEELKESRRKALFEPRQVDLKPLAEINRVLGDAAAMFAVGAREGAGGGNELVSEAMRQLDDLRDTLGPDERNAVERKISEFIQTNFEDTDDAKDIHENLQLGVAQPVAVLPISVGARRRGVGEIVAEVTGLEPESTSSSTSVRGPAPPAAGSPSPATSSGGGSASQEQAAEGVGMGVPMPAPVAMPTGPGPALQAVLAAQKAQKGLGPIGSPIYTRQPRRDAPLAAFLKANEPGRPTPTVEARGTEAEVEGAVRTPERKGALDVSRFLPPPRPSTPPVPTATTDAGTSWSSTTGNRPVTYTLRGGELYAKPEGAPEVRLEEGTVEHEFALEDRAKALAAPPPDTSAALSVLARRKKSSAYA